MPLAVSATTLQRPSTEVSTNERTWSPNVAEEVAVSATTPPAVAAAGEAASRVIASICGEAGVLRPRAWPRRGTT